jgi:hypothetical protein
VIDERHITSPLGVRELVDTLAELATFLALFSGSATSTDNYNLRFRHDDSFLT